MRKPGPTRTLREHRARAYLTARQLADLANVSVATVWNVELHRGLRTKATTMQRIAGALGLHPSEIAEFRVEL
jgi:transcriptional regulator with XRE-family HTH domain